VCVVVCVAVSAAVRVAVCVAVIRMYYMRMFVGSITRVAGEHVCCSVCCSVCSSYVYVLFTSPRQHHHPRRWQAVCIVLCAAVCVAVCVTVICMYYIQVLVGSITRVACKQFVLCCVLQCVLQDVLQ